MSAEVAVADERILEALRDGMREHGRPPTIAEITLATGYTREAVEERLRKLEEAGRVELIRERGGKAKGLRVEPSNVVFPERFRRHPSDLPEQEELGTIADDALGFDEIAQRSGVELAELVVNVTGTPKPQGSKDPLMRESAGEELARWRGAIAIAADATRRRAGIPRFEGPVELWIVFRMHKPQRPAFPIPAVRPDIDKLERAVLDALTEAGVYRDDGQVTDVRKRQRYASGPTGVSIIVRGWR